MSDRSLIVMMMIGLAGILLSGCTDEERSRETLQKSGYSNIHVGGFDGWSCSKDDHYSTHFKATNPAGQMVEGTVCCGMFKSCTVRF